MATTVRDIALRTPLSLPPDTTIALAEDHLIQAGAAEIFLTDPEERLLGIVPDYELLKYRLLAGDPAAPISRLMSPVQVALPPDAPLEAAARLLREHVHPSVPIVQHGRLIGQLSRNSLLRILAGETDAPMTLEPEENRPAVPAPKFSKVLQFAQAALSITR